MVVDDVATLRDAVVVSRGYPLLSGVFLSLRARSVTVVTGANGAGKTSLLRVLAGLEELASGDGTVLGVDLRRGDRREIRRRVGWLGHEGSLYDELTVGENLDFARRATGIDGDVAAVLERVGLATRAAVVTKQLSAGQRRRLALAWLLLRRPSLWLLDEPFASLDESARELLDHAVAEASRAGATVVLTSHDLPSSASYDFSIHQLVGGRFAEVAR